MVHIDSRATWRPTGHRSKLARLGKRSPFGGRGEAVGVARRVAALEPDLVHATAAERVTFDEEPLVETDSARRGDVELGHPRTDPVGVELLVPRPVERVREVHALAVAADLDHLRAAEQRSVRPGRMRCPRDDAAAPHRAGLPWREGTSHVALPELAGAAARDGQ